MLQHCVQQFAKLLSGETRLNILELRSIYKTIGGEPVLKNVDLSLASGTIVVIRGRSGVGKTTLAKVASLLLKPDKGKVAFMGRDVGGLEDAELSALRLKYVGYVDQECTLIEELTVRENVALPLKLLGVRKAALEEALNEIFEILGLKGLELRKPRELSGGQRQRVALARALVKRPKLLVLDEPFAHLDDETVKLVINYLRLLARENGVAVMLTTTDLYTHMDTDGDYVLADGALRENTRGSNTLSAS